MTFVGPDPYSLSGSRIWIQGAIKCKKRSTFGGFFSFFKNYFLIVNLYFKTFKIYLLKLCWGSRSALYPDLMTLWIRIRVELKCWIRIRIRKKSILIHNPLNKLANFLKPNPQKVDRCLYQITCSCLNKVTVLPG
jgi:hypothetical protein